MDAVTANLRKLAQFKGRESRGAFWPYAGTVFLLAMAGTAVAMGATIAQTFANVEKLAAEHPEAVTVRAGPGSYSVEVHGHPEVMPDLTPAMHGIAVVGAAAVVLLAAAVARRLHDSGMRAWWGLMPLPFLAYSLATFPKLTANLDAPDEVMLPLFMSVFFSNVLYLGGLAGLVLLLCRTGTPGPNRFGEAP